MKKAFKTVFNPPPRLTLILTLIGFASVLAVPVFGIENPVYCYVSYLLSAYALVITITGLKYLRDFAASSKKKFLESGPVRKFRSTSLGGRYFGDIHFRAHISLVVSLTINICYIIVKLYAGVRYRSAWFLALAGYYILLAVMRLVLVRHYGSSNADISAEYRLYRRC